jgi:hypothetical protein
VLATVRSKDGDPQAGFDQAMGNLLAKTIARGCEIGKIDTWNVED